MNISFEMLNSENNLKGRVVVEKFAEFKIEETNYKSERAKCCEALKSCSRHVNKFENVEQDEDLEKVELREKCLHELYCRKSGFAVRFSRKRLMNA